MTCENPHAVLGIPASAKPSEVKAAFRKLAKMFHPDARPGDPAAAERFREVTTAYEALSGTIRRPVSGDGRRAGEETADAAFEDIFRMARTRADERGRARGGKDEEGCLSLTLEQAYRGGIMSLRTGSGRALRFAVPAGLTEGSRIRLPGKGGKGADGGNDGDLVLAVSLTPHPAFELVGGNLHATIEVPFTFAALGGGAAALRHLDGRELEIAVPPMRFGVAELALEGEGWPTSGGRRGDLLVKVRATYPENLTDEQRELLLALAKTRWSHRR